MKIKKMISAWALRVFLVLVLNSFFLQFGIASENLSSIIQTDGHWENICKSLTPSTPIQISTNGTLLYIESTSTNCDITINIVNSSEDIVYEQTVSAAETSLIIIPLAELPVGTYQLELSNLLGGYLKGSFTVSY